MEMVEIPFPTYNALYNRIHKAEATISKIGVTDVNQEYTLIFLFNEDTEKVFLVYKKKGPYPNTHNGVGGKLETGETPLAGAIREVKEETGVDITDTIRPLITCVFPTSVTLYVFYAQVAEYEPRQMEDEFMDWYDVNEILENPRYIRLAGDGNTRYFIEASLKEIRIDGRD